jgi:hypothetical protein
VYVEISLRTAIIPDAVTLEHVSKVNPLLMACRYIMTKL